MKERGQPVIEHILALIELFQSGRADGKTVPTALSEQEMQAAYEMIDFMEEIPGGFLIYRAGGEEEILYANRGLQRIFLCESMAEFQRLTGNSFRGMIHPEDLEAAEESIQRQISASQFDLDYVEYRIRRKDGAIRWIEDYGHFVHSESIGDIFYVFLVDATEKKERQQTERTRLLWEKEASEQKWQALIEEYDKERALISQEYLRRLEVIEGLSVNYESIFYADLDEEKILPYRLSGRTEAIFNENSAMDYVLCLEQYVDAWVHEEDREMVARETSPGSVRSRLTGDLTFYINYRVVEQGTVEYLQVRYVNVGRKDLASQVVIGCRRVDEELRRELEHKQVLEEALRSANSSIVAKNTFLSNMSHDMRTPLNAIFGFTALAKNNLGKPEVMAGYLDRIEASSRQLLDMIDKVLKLSWMDSNEAKAEEKPCRLSEILEEVYSFLLPQAEEKGLKFSMDCSQVRHDEILGDREKLSQLVMYLANNAVTYTLTGGSVGLSAAEREELPNCCAVYQISVQDTGIGIGEDFLQQIFEPFTRERNTTLSGVHGVGLGLTIARNLAELLGGSIEVASAVGKGSTFTVTLRLRLQQEPESQTSGGDSAAEAAPYKLLLVEDNELNLEIATSLLEDLGFFVDTAEDGGVALEKVRTSSPGDYDLILMDIQMPVMNGWQAAKAIRALPDPALANIPIVALSANVFESDIRKSIASGMQAHLAKPLDIPALLRAINEYVRRNKE